MTHELLHLSSSMHAACTCTSTQNACLQICKDAAVHADALVNGVAGTRHLQSASSSVCSGGCFALIVRVYQLCDLLHTKLCQLE